MKLLNSRLLPILAVASIATLSGCGDGDEEIRIYQISHPEGLDPHAGHDHGPGEDHSGHDHAAPASAAPMAPTAPSSTPSQNSVNPSSSMNTLPGMESTAAAIDTPAWSVPASWDELAPTSIRKGNFRIGTGNQIAEITVTAFPGDVGGLEANVNRWRGQIGLPPSSMDSMGDTIIPIEVDGQPAYGITLLNPQNPDAPGILGAVIPRDGMTWFVKMIGSQEILQSQEGDLQNFLNSITF